jgi:site-specific recombinase XerC
MIGESLTSILPRFIESLKVKGRSPATILAYRADLDQLILLKDFVTGYSCKSILPNQLQGN